MESKRFDHITATTPFIQSGYAESASQDHPVVGNTDVAKPWLITLIRRLLITLAVIVVLAVTLTFLVIDSDPLVEDQHAQQLENADSVRSLLDQLKYSLKRRARAQDILLYEDQLNSLVGLAKRAHPAFSGEVQVAPSESVLHASYALPANPFGQYLNLTVRILPANHLLIRDVSIGSITLPGDWVLSAAERLANWYTKSDIATQTLAQVEHVKMHKDSLRVRVRPLEHWLAQLNLVKNGLGPNQDEFLRRRTAHYLKFLAYLNVDREDRQLSLVAYMAPLFVEVAQQSEGTNPVYENEAAILALAIYTGHHRLANFVGDVQPVQGEASLPRYRPRLAGRTDLTQHFVLSAAIKVLSQQGVSAAVGEFKELMDRASGGSGYSFVDLAADMAGVNFAMIATDPVLAVQLQNMVGSQDLNEATFFPDIGGLPEGLNKQEFAETFGELDSPAYRAQLAEIQDKLNQLALYKLDT